MNSIKFISIHDIITSQLAEGAIFNDEYIGFREDYLTLHCLLRLFNPKSVLEIGTNMGTGTQIIKNALPQSDVYSLDLPAELSHISLQHPISEGKGDRVGSRCSLPYTQLRGDSMFFLYNSIPQMDCWFIDGEHDYKHVSHESEEAVSHGAWLIIFHDADIEVVWKAIVDSFYEKEYILHRVEGTRIAYALKEYNHESGNNNYNL